MIIFHSRHLDKKRFSPLLSRVFSVSCRGFEWVSREVNLNLFSLLRLRRALAIAKLLLLLLHRIISHRKNSFFSLKQFSPSCGGTVRGLWLHVSDRSTLQKVLMGFSTFWELFIKSFFQGTQASPSWHHSDIFSTLVSLWAHEIPAWRWQTARLCFLYFPPPRSSSFPRLWCKIIQQMLNESIFNCK